MSEKRTRRAALGLMAAGSALVAADTRAFTSLIADRTLDVEVAGDREDAVIGIRNETLVDGHTYDDLPHSIELKNNFEEPVTMTASVGADFEVVTEAENFGSDADVDPNGETWLEIDVDGADSATDVVELTAAGDSATAELDRKITLDGFEPSDDDEDFMVWLDADEEETFSYGDKPDVDSWETRAEEGLDSVDAAGDSPPTRHDGDDHDWDLDPTVEFEDDDVLSGSSIDLSETNVASILAVIDPDDGDRAVSLVDGGNDGQQVSFDANDGQVTVGLEDTNGDVQIETADLPVGSAPVVVSVVVEGENTDDEETETFQIRTYTSTDQGEVVELTDRTVSIGDFTLGVGGDPEAIDDTDLESGEGFEGAISEIHIYDRVVDNGEGDGDELEDLVDYLEDKWGI